MGHILPSLRLYCKVWRRLTFSSFASTIRKVVHDSSLTDEYFLLVASDVSKLPTGHHGTSESHQILRVNLINIGKGVRVLG